MPTRHLYTRFPALIFSFVLFTLSPAAGQWQPTGPPSVEMASFARNSTYIFGTLSKYGTPLYRSSNRGADWEPLSPNAFYSTSSNNSISVVHADDMVVLVEEYAAFRESHLYRSIDNGENWQEVPYLGSGVSLNGSSVVRIEEKVYALFTDRDIPGIIAFSSDNGVSWTPFVESTLDVDRMIEIYGVADTLVLLGEDATGSALYLTSDDGATWITRRLPEDFESGQSVLIDNRLILSGGNGDFIYTDDLGATWSQSRSVPRQTPFFDIVGEGRYVIATGDSTAYYSTDTGATWQLSDFDSYPHTYPLYNGRRRNPRYGIATGDGFIFGHDADIGNVRTDSGRFWTSFGNGLPQDRHVLSMARHGDRLLIRSDEFFHSDDGGTTWRINRQQARSNQNGPLFSASRGFFQGRSDALYFSESGEEWEKIEGSPEEVRYFSSEEDVILASNTNGELWRSGNGGESWVILESFPERASEVEIIGDVYLVGSSVLYRSTDQGTTWSSVPSNDQGPLIFDPIVESSGRLLGEGTTGEFLLYSSADSGSTWLDITDRLPATWSSNDLYHGTTLFAFDSLIVADVRHDRVFEHFVSSNMGETWKKIETGTDSTLLGSIAGMERVGDRLIAAINRTTSVGYGVFRLSISEITASNSVEWTPARQRDEHGMLIYNQATGTISWQIDQPGEVSIRLYTISGQTAAEIFSGYSSSRVERTSFSTEDLPSGYYFMTIEKGGETIAEERVLVTR